MELAKTIVSGRPVPEDDYEDPDAEPVAVKPPPKKKKKGPFLKLEKPLKKKRPEPEDPIAVLLQNAGADDTATKVNGNGKKKTTKVVEQDIESDEDDEAEEAESNGIVVIDDEEARQAAKEACDKEEKEVRAWEVVSICAYISGILGAIGLVIGFNSARWFPFYIIAGVAYWAVGTMAGLILLHFCQWFDESIRDRAVQCWYGAVRRLCWVTSAFTWILKK